MISSPTESSKNLGSFRVSHAKPFSMLNIPNGSIVRRTDCAKSAYQIVPITL